MQGEIVEPASLQLAAACGEPHLPIGQALMAALLASAITCGMLRHASVLERASSGLQRACALHTADFVACVEWIIKQDNLAALVGPTSRDVKTSLHARFGSNRHMFYIDDVLTLLQFLGMDVADIDMNMCRYIPDPRGQKS